LIGVFSRTQEARVVMVAGGTGGHVFPAISIAHHLMEKFHIIFVTDKRGKKYLNSSPWELIVQSIFIKNRIILYLSLIVNLLKAVYFLLKSRPLCVIGFGGYPSVPFVLAAQILRIKTIIHEQNAVIGKANKLLSKFADKSILSFGNTSNVVGTPTRFEHIYDDFHYNPSSSPNFVLLVLGGSQGSSIITKKIAECLCSLSKSIRSNLFVYHQVRAEDMDYVTKTYRNYGITSEIRSFFDNLNEIYTKTDLVIARSGASTLFEIIGFKLPSILIPFRNSINGDQKANASLMQKIGASIVFSEDCLPNSIAEKIKEMYENRGILKNMSNNASKLYVNHITKRIIKIIISQIQTA
jgi:UDP-N-acetylglucosamine--N-acetylmuramyl-(pentapeptide) pyrophosphoryl-undecaprenol N-acetylglucosamine transferase